jgi:hypothetical protein
VNRRVGMVVIGAVIVAGTTLGIPHSASAAQGTRPCPSDYYCFYNNAKYGTDPALFNNAQPNWHLNYNSTSSGSFNNAPSSTGGDRRNQLSSIINNGRRTICVYDNAGGNRRLIQRIAPYQDYPFISVNDKADSWVIHPGNTPCGS